MKTSIVAALCACLCAASLSAQSNAGTSANGDFGFSSAGKSMQLRFDARRHSNGKIGGEIVLAGTVDLADQDVDGDNTPSPGSSVSVSMKVDVDCLNVSGNRATLTGIVTESSVNAYVGRRALLAVEDNGEGSKTADPDRFTWGLYGSNAPNWVASDAELLFDPGVGLTWLATDSERNDDAGIPSHKSGLVDCLTFPAASYSLEDVQKGMGNLQVRP